MLLKTLNLTFIELGGLGELGIKEKL